MAISHLNCGRSAAKPSSKGLAEEVEARRAE
ncbi:hypothetical protein SNOG_09072 [Parastagonospora nodorum SN15]|uniref:Uncharacterized protein n=1 Tax=Phaeosphaeria nodorum (strain SN15 / ATCC MYA-4574 / FGSC 10173) TaxID=321614 RepID=Q0UGP2_PHANO|nr:hypothetical protein SNOG_09072 [Parastagonospora nodorum SN15]EAT83264.1 hypothetical protein SNOG_09072 [Parastagonospora nodorum SN15]